MGNCCGPKSSPNHDDLTVDEQKAHDEIGTSLISAYKNDNKVKKLLLLGAGSSGKSTLFRQLKCIYQSGFQETEINETIPIIRRNCVSGLMTLLKKTQQLYEKDEKQNGDCYMDLDNISEQCLTAIRCIVTFSKDTFEDYENEFADYMNKVDDDDTTIDDYTEKRIQAKKNELYTLGSSIEILWNQSSIQTTFAKRNVFFYSFPDNMEYFFNKVGKVFEWNYYPSADDILKCRIRTTGLIHAFYEEKKIAFTITDVGGQRNERRKWIHGFEMVTAVIFVAALNHYAAVLFEDESKNAMIESVELFFETCNLKWFRKTEIILFLNKNDLFRQYIEADLALTACFNTQNGCIHKPEYDDDQNYYPKKPTKKAKKQNTKKEKISDEEENNLSGFNYDFETEAIRGSYIPPKLTDENESYEYRARTAIYPKQKLRIGAKDSYDGGKWATEANDKWFDFVYNDYIHFITEQYLSKNLHPEYKRIFVHVTTATDPSNIKKVFWNVQNIIIRSNLKHGGLV